MLTKNSIIEWPDPAGKSSRDRILHIDPQQGQTVVINLDEPDSLPRWAETTTLEDALAVGEAHLLQNDPWATRRGLVEEEIPDSHRLRRDQNWDAIKTIVENPAVAFHQNKRFPLIKKSQIPRNKVYRLLKRYWQGGQTRNTLLPDFKGREKTSATQKVGRKGRIEITHLIEKKFEEGIKKFYEVPEKPSLARAYGLIVTHLFAGVEGPKHTRRAPEETLKDVPTFRQFNYWMKTRRDKERSTRRRLGGTRFAMDKRPLLGTATDGISGPGAVYQIDSTSADIHLVSMTDRSQLVGRPTLFLVTDVFSRLITGFSIALEGASYNLSSLAILNCTENKVSYCAQNGVDIHPEEWPCQHLPECLTADRGELEGPMATVIVEGLNIRLDNTPPFRADMKGVIESKFQSANLGLIHWLPGGIQGKLKRGEKDPRDSASLNIKEFTQLVIFWILEYNRSAVGKYPLDPEMIRDKVQPIPTKLWGWGIQNRSGSLRMEEASVVQSQLLPREEAAVTRQGIQYKGTHYTCKTAEEENWFFRAGDSGAWKVKIAVDPRNCSNTFLQHRDGRLEPCKLTSRSKDFEGLPWTEVVELRQISKKLIASAKDQTLIQKGEFHRNVDEIVSKAKAEAKKKPPLRSTKITEARRNELETLAKSKLQTEPPKIIPLPAPKKTEYIGAPDDLDELRKLREERE